MSFLSKKVPPKKDGLLSGKKTDAEDLDALFGGDEKPTSAAPAPAKKAPVDPSRLIPTIGFCAPHLPAW